MARFYQCLPRHRNRRRLDGDGAFQVRRSACIASCSSGCSGSSSSTRSGYRSGSARRSSSSAAVLLFFAWKTDRKDKAARAGLDDISPSEPAVASSARSRCSSLSGCSQGRTSRRAQSRRSRDRDGDTLDLRSGARVRLVQIDAPSSGRASATRGATRARALAPRARSSSRPIPARRQRSLRPLLATSRRDERERRARRGAAAPYFRAATRGLRRRAARRGRRRARGPGCGARAGSWDPTGCHHSSEVGRPSDEGRSRGQPRPSARRLWTSSGRCGGR